MILGAGGDAIVLAESISHASSEWQLIGFLDDSKTRADDMHDAPLLGALDDWARLPSSCVFIAALHKVGKMAERSQRILGLGIPDSRWATVVDPTARIAQRAKIGRNVYLGPNAVVQPGAIVGNHVSIRAGANIGHHARVDDFCYVGPNSTLCGASKMERGSHLGPNSCIVDGQSLGEYAVVGICSAVTKRLPAYGIYLGFLLQRSGQANHE